MTVFFKTKIYNYSYHLIMGQKILINMFRNKAISEGVDKGTLTADEPNNKKTAQSHTDTLMPLTWCVYVMYSFCLRNYG